MQFDLLTLFPGFFESPLKISLIGKAISRGILTVNLHNLRDWATDKHHTVDDVPYGGGPGMVLKPEPIAAALDEIDGRGGSRTAPTKTRRLYFSPQGTPLRQDRLKGYLQYDQILLLCGRYEGVDQRILDHFIDEEISIGDYVVSGGEVAALVFLEAVSRLIPGVVGKEESVQDESFVVGAHRDAPLLEYPQFTRPPVFRGWEVPSVLLSGDHEKIRRWRLEEAVRITQERRPDLKR